MHSIESIPKLPKLLQLFISDYVEGDVSRMSQPQPYLEHVLPASTFLRFSYVLITYFLKIINMFLKFLKIESSLSDLKLSFSC